MKMPDGWYPRLFRGVVFPTLDALNRTNVSRYFRSLERSQWLPRADLQNLQNAKLTNILAWTRENSDFYSRFWREAAMERRAASAYPELDGLPIVTKADLRSAREQFPLASYRGRSYAIKTSGSTGEPMTYFRSAEQESMFWALRLRMWEWGGYVQGEPYLTLNLNPRSAWKKRLQDVLFRCSYHGFNANKHDVEAVLSALTKKRIKHLIGYASSLYLLSQAMNRLGVSNPGIEHILSTGDTLFPSYRHTIEETFGVGVVDYYGAGGEGFHLASQCEQRDRYHLHVENSVIEILKEGRPAAPGELGEVVVTQLDNRAMPLVRYATQDVAVPSEQRACACGRELPLLERIEGRVADIVIAPNGSALVVHFFTILFEHLSGIRLFQIIQAHQDRITARIVTTPDYAKATTEERIRRSVAEATESSLQVEFEYVNNILLSPSNKRRFVISVISPSFAERESETNGSSARADPESPLA
ncbi:MAG: phenylacetate--CoA ligase family protein [bacterium]|nr:phenylacetate--CoA ligase family protein [bacterium]